MQTIELREPLSLSERHRAVPIRLVISLDISPTEKFRSIGTHFDPSVLASLPAEIVEAIFFRGIADGVIEGWYKSGVKLPEDGSDVNFRVQDFSLALSLESLLDDELQELSGQLRKVAAEGVRKLLGSPLTE